MTCLHGVFRSKSKQIPFSIFPPSESQFLPPGMKSFFCCLLLHLTTTAFASPVSEDLNPLQNTNAGSDNGGTSNHPAPSTLTFPTVPSTSAAPTIFTFTSIAKSQQEDSSKKLKGRPGQQSGSRADESDQQRQARTEANRKRNLYWQGRRAAESDEERRARLFKQRNRDCRGREKLRSNPSAHAKFKEADRIRHRNSRAGMKKARELAERNAAAESEKVGKFTERNFNAVMLDLNQLPVGETPVLRNFDTLQLDLNQLPIDETPLPHVQLDLNQLPVDENPFRSFSYM